MSTAPAVPTHVRATGETITPVATPFHRRRIDPGSDTADLARTLDQHMNDVEKATRAVRALPIPVVLQDIAFTNGSSITLQHRLGTDRVLCEVFDHHALTSGVPLQYGTASDATSYTLHALGTFVASVRFVVKP